MTQDAQDDSKTVIARISAAARIVDKRSREMFMFADDEAHLRLNSSILSKLDTSQPLAESEIVVTLRKLFQALLETNIVRVSWRTVDHDGTVTRFIVSSDWSASQSLEAIMSTLYADDVEYAVLSQEASFTFTDIADGCERTKTVVKDVMTLGKLDDREGFETA